MTTQGGARRHRVFYRLGWRESPRYAGSFKSKKEATRRKAWVLGELAAMKVPDLTVLKAPAKKPTLREAADTWRESRHDVTEGTRTLHRVALDRVLPALGAKPVDKITADDVTGVVKALAEAGKKRETIKKSVTYLAAVLDDAGADPNPAKAKKVRLPHEDREEPNPPTAEHVEAVARLLAPAYPDGLTFGSTGRAPGSRRSSSRRSATTTSRPGASDNARRRRRTARPFGPTCPTCSPRRSRRACLRVRTATSRAAVRRRDRRPAPHGDHPGLQGGRRPEVHAARPTTPARESPSPSGRTWAEIGRLVGQKKLSVTADTYTHVLSDGREADYEALLAA